jgi:hypothetical protein
MNLQKILVPVLGVVIVAAGWRAYGWGGVALTTGGILMWALLHFNRAMQVLKRAGDRPIGYVDSAVMLNAKLKPRVNLLHVIAMTRALGELVSPQNEQPEIWRWTDSSASHVTCEFVNGKLVKWTLYRPPAPQEASTAPPL